MLSWLRLCPAPQGSWWYKSVKYGSTNILIQTRVLMILATAVEFSPSNQAGVKNRPSDDIFCT
uniref:Uncharacterized protein n=1 Tax=Amphimedon queenslandica TaxID=400682 RepID=A0A1X7T6M7_AMPQE